MTDKDIINYLWPKKHCLYKRYLRNNKILNNILEYLNNRYLDSTCIEETIYRIKYNIEERPKCKKCGKPTKFITHYGSFGKFNMFCSRNCQIDQEKIKESVRNKYGVDNVNQLDFVKEKKKQTLLNRYNITNSYCLNKCKEKSKNTRQKNKKKWLDKIKKTCLEKYGVLNPAKSEIIKNKSKQTCLKKYGVTHHMKSKEVLEKFDFDTIIKKQLETKKKNNSFNTSKTEDQSYILLKEKCPDVLRQYRSELYPFNCDFYIPSLDLYIECQYGQFHHQRPYIGNKQDLKDVKILKEKANKIHKQNNVEISRYDVELETWTIRDVKKRNVAKQNNLNYIEFWNIEELKNWLDKQNEI